MGLKVSIAKMFSPFDAHTKYLRRRRCDSVRLLSETLVVVASVVFLRLWS